MYLSSLLDNLLKAFVHNLGFQVLPQTLAQWASSVKPLSWPLFEAHGNVFSTYKFQKVNCATDNFSDLGGIFFLTIQWPKLLYSPTRVLCLGTVDSELSLCRLWIVEENSPFLASVSSLLHIHLDPYPVWVTIFSLIMREKNLMAN